MAPPRAARVLIVAGSDSGGGAGIQADIKTVTALGGFAATAITALTAQNTREVRDVLPVPPEFIQAQMRTVLEDIGADCFKTGMLHDAAVITAVAEVLAEYPRVPLILDPVMVAESGARLLEPSAVQALCEELVPRARLITPNLPEAEVLLGATIADHADQRAAARELSQRLGVPVLLKGGHLRGEVLRDVLVWEQGERVFEDPRIQTSNTHGTGCTLASAIATGIAAGASLEHAVEQGRAYLRGALQAARPLGRGHGPVWHGHTLRSD